MPVRYLYLFPQSHTHAAQVASTPFGCRFGCRCVIFGIAALRRPHTHTHTSLVNLICCTSRRSERASNLMMKKLEELIEYDAQIKHDVDGERSMRLMVML